MAPVAAETFTLPHWSEGTYHHGLLQIALDHAPGAHQLRFARAPETTQARYARIMATGNADYDTLALAYSPQRDDRLKAVPIPLIRGMLGYRRLLIRADRESLTHGADGKEIPARDLVLGSAPTWPDTQILKAGGFRLFTATYDKLFDLVRRGRVDALPRSVTEVAMELAIANRQPGKARIRVADDLILAYRSPLFFYVRADDTARQRIITKGLKAAYLSGAFMRHFNADPGVQDTLDLIARGQARVVWLDNPLLSASVRAIPDKYWQAPPCVPPQCTPMPAMGGGHGIIPHNRARWDQ
ncbi:hypothetical protein [Yunchengibacter salinarum]|uniref:hypothetical protein n=1 Tax=Yunchengibacter salinarum TaxID=3133399 RepID=UPI0035B61476